ncbi:hypothetical protein [Shinella sp.]|uniref:hypothetical protein n=1 Tax=Shinella sp. TaxID=1870904 RepID=UPI004035762F
MAILLGLWLKLKGYLAAAGMALAILAGVFLYGRSDGKADAEAEQARNNSKAIKKARGVEDAVQGMGSADVDAGLAKWMRDGKR